MTSGQVPRGADNTVGAVIAPSLVQCSQINLQHCKAATVLLSRSQVVEQTDICLIQEPRTGGMARGLDLRGYELFFAQGEPGPRTCISVKRACNARRMVNFCHRDLVAVTVGLRGEGGYEDIVFCSAYFPFDSALTPPTGELKKWSRYCKSNGLPLIVGCDANAQNVVWGSESNNARGISLLEYLADEDLEILNRGFRPTFVTSRCQCVIDITLCDRRLAKRCVDWRVDREDTLSDHRPIKFSIEGRFGKLEGPARRNGPLVKRSWSQGWGNGG
ncbi:uncharacterized protein [Fopius arisanus]|uniref:Endonuclease/exonuclease/phosphatase domain-containing protein n=1 Tax=Fopius arisanus TaxID=64838 RepID=A0A9R1TQC6_9HYME|nr:PREDICTED: uncharacterized protein LOC105272899 [Fopius arisanus]